MKFSKLLLVLIAIVPLAMSAGWVNAQPPGDHFGHRPKGEGHMHLQELGLTEDQARAFHQAMMANRENQRALQELQQRLTQMAFSDNYNPTEAANVIQQYNENMASKLAEAIQTQNNLYAQLTAEQKSAVSEMLSRHGDRRER